MLIPVSSVGGPDSRGCGHYSTASSGRARFVPPLSFPLPFLLIWPSPSSPPSPLPSLLSILFLLIWSSPPSSLSLSPLHSLSLHSQSRLLTISLLSLHLPGVNLSKTELQLNIRPLLRLVCQRFLGDFNCQCFFVLHL